MKDIFFLWYSRRWFKIVFNLPEKKTEKKYLLINYSITTKFKNKLEKKNKKTETGRRWLEDIKGFLSPKYLKSSSKDFVTEEISKDLP